MWTVFENFLLLNVRAGTGEEGYMDSNIIRIKFVGETPRKICVIILLGGSYLRQTQ